MSEKTDIKPPKGKRQKGNRGEEDNVETDTQASSTESKTTTLGQHERGLFWKTPLDLEVNKAKWWMVFGSLVVAAFVTRLHKIELPRHICWDETHFGKMGSYYINRTFFFDVHPPLGKMLIGLSGKLTGYNGEFSFEKPGMTYPPDINYVGMRIFCALLGVSLIPLGFGIVWELTHSIIASIIAGLFILFDTGTLILSRYILLDPIMMFFILASTYCYVKFYSYNASSFSPQWWLWLTLTGTSLACAISVKFVGLFVILLVGFSTIKELWDLLGNKENSIVLLVKHFLARAVCLIILPIILYIILFGIHLKILNETGTGDGFYSSAFQSTLKGNKLHGASMPEDVAYGSTITVKNSQTGGAYLHSHFHLYPEGIGAKQQQVTAYSHKDDNNLWIVMKENVNSKIEDPVEYVRHGDVVRLMHVATTRNLHSHKEKAPLTQRHHQVTCYGMNGTGDYHDNFQVEIVGGVPGEVVKAVKKKFTLRHLGQNCAVTQTERKLPKWGWDQMEVTCNPHAIDVKSYWNVEEVRDSRLPSVSFANHAPNFIQKFIESHIVMGKGNRGLKPKEDEATSQPWQWPLDWSGQSFSGGKFRVLLLGNPILFWGNLILMAVFIMLFIYDGVKSKRGTTQPQEIRDYRSSRFSACMWLIGGWGLHYIPFWTMGRVLYFHHYFPAYLFNAMFSAVVIEYGLTCIRLCFSKHIAMNVYHTALGVILAGIFYSFYLFSPLAYGTSGPTALDVNATMYGLKWLDTWDF
ncbi:protein O-mannosyl-transferase 2 [Lingula anatina]|uniref:Protein O-mannosyl-transferase 2 n=1 Tax=Lingula anatina TaxID=7574 RepID=A0A1S3JDE1_LINAN|nr:protein O-mannosyl-transferase 2 [Lingula anatina]|eukprot:XP_013407904.1 protein O-mannosyl-transferase 2 [Lingula anatina]